MNTRGRAITVSLLAISIIAISHFFRFEDDSSNSLKLLIVLALVGITLTWGTLWVLFYKVNLKFLISGVLFPFLCFLPFWGLSETLVNSIANVVELNIAYLLVDIGLFVLLYMLILTTNILNGARLKDVPLGQAAKAAHFVFTLVATYFLFTFLFNGGFNVVIGMLVTLLYIGYLTFSSLAILELKPREESLSVLLITLLIVLVFGLISIWPVLSLYSTVVMTIIFYLFLNVALEMREQITKYIWFEYALLLSLMVFILLINAGWGVNGTLI